MWMFNALSSVFTPMYMCLFFVDLNPNENGWNTDENGLIKSSHLRFRSLSLQKLLIIVIRFIIFLGFNFQSS